MKKYIACILSLALIFCGGGCKNEDEETTEPAASLYSDEFEQVTTLHAREKTAYQYDTWYLRNVTTDGQTVEYTQNGQTIRYTNVCPVRIFLDGELKTSIYVVGQARFKISAESIIYKEQDTGYFEIWVKDLNGENHFLTKDGSELVSEIQITELTDSNKIDIELPGIWTNTSETALYAFTVEIYKPKDES